MSQTTAGLREDCVRALLSPEYRHSQNRTGLHAAQSAPNRPALPPCWHEAARESPKPAAIRLARRWSYVSVLRGLGKDDHRRVGPSGHLSAQAEGPLPPVLDRSRELKGQEEKSECMRACSFPRAHYIHLCCSRQSLREPRQGQFGVRNGRK